MSPPLDGLRILDLTRLLPGPFCTQILGDLGADVIKIEEPGSGDPARQYPPLVGDTGALFLMVNRNKRSVCLNLKADAGRDLLLKLVEDADVLVESFRPGVMDRLGLGYPVLQARNARLIYATLSGFGQSGPDVHRAGHDLNYLALAGLLGYNADAAGQPVPPGVQIADLAGGSLAAIAILAAIVGRQQAGRGQAVDVSLYGSALAWLPTLLATRVGLGRAPAPGEPPLAGGLAHYAIYETADGRHVTLGALEPKLLQAFLDAVGRPELAALARSDSGADRDALRAELQAIFATHTLADWVACLANVDTCFAPVNTLDEAVVEPQALALGMFTSVAHARLGTVPQIGVPITLSDTPGGIFRPPPDLGEHTTEVLSQLGLKAEAVAELRRRGVC